MSRFSRRVVVALLLCTFGLLTAPVFASSPDDIRTSQVMIRWQALVEQVLSWVSIAPKGRTPVESKDDDPPMPGDPNKPPVEPGEINYTPDPDG